MFDQMVHTQNRNKFPQAELDQYAGKCVAWSFDGTQILASGATYTELFREIDRLGLTEYALAYIDDPDKPRWDNDLPDPEAEAAILARDPANRTG